MESTRNLVPGKASRLVKRHGWDWVHGLDFKLARGLGSQPAGEPVCVLLGEDSGGHVLRTRTAGQDLVGVYKLCNFSQDGCWGKSVFQHVNISCLPKNVYIFFPAYQRKWPSTYP
jgi:hypothetical protein